MTGADWLMRISLSALVVLLMCCKSGPAESKRGVPPKSAKGPQKLALLVGIDKYGKAATPDVPDDEQWRPLGGTKNDIDALRDELDRRGFYVRTLLDADATKEGILNAFKEHLVDGSSPGRGDVVLFHYSGHGQQIPDDNADEADGYDEALVPYDNKGIKDFSNHLRDDELGQLLEALAAKTDNVVVTLDSCHSGTGTRSHFATRGGPPVHPPAQTRGAAADGASGLLPKGKKSTAGYVLLTAARPDQLAGETRDPATRAVMGAFTYQLVKALRAAGPKTTYKQLIDRIGVKILSMTKNQNPQIEGDASKVLFSGRWTTPPQYYRVRPMEGSTVKVEAGSLHGLAVGSVLAVYPLGTKDMDKAKPFAELEVTKVELGLATCRLTDKYASVGASKFANGAQAIEIYSKRSPTRVRVAIQGGGAAAKRLAELKFVETLEGGGATRGADGPDWDVRLEESGGQLKLVSSDGAHIPIPTGPEQPTRASIPSDDPAAAGRLAEALEAWFRRARVAALTNDDRRTKLDVTLSAAVVDAEMTDSGPKITKRHRTIAKSGDDGISQGKLLALTVNNRTSKKVFISVLELTPDGGIHVLYPMEDMDSGENQLAPRQVLTLPYPFEVTPPSGTAVVKLIATTDDIDFRALEHRVKTGGATRSDASALEIMMEGVLDGKRAKPFGYTKKEKWGTDDLRFEVR